MNDLAAQSLDLVNRELATTLDGARRELESYVDGVSGPDALKHCEELLHLAAGALKVVDVQGAALLAEEMEYTCRGLIGLDDQRIIEQGLDALSRAMVQLPAYVDRLLSGGRDVALVLLPLLNDLRRVRGKPLLSEGTLLLLNGGPVGERRPARRPDAAAEGREVSEIALKLRPAFQAALLGWIRGDRPEHRLSELARITRALEEAAKTEAVQQLWHVLGGLLLAVQLNALEATVAVKRLVGQADRQLKRLVDGGEWPIANSPPIDLLNNMLYCIARADSDDQRLRAIRDAYGLNEVPAEEQVDEARSVLAGPSVKLMRTVAQAIKEDLDSVKDVLDIFVRTGMTDLDQLGPQLEMLKKISDTLGVLGLEKLRGRIHAQADELGLVVSDKRTADESLLEGIAATLLDVEDALDRELIRAVTPSEDEQESVESDSEAQYRHVMQAVMGECIVNLAKVKEAVVQVAEDPANVRALDQVTPQLRGITAGLLMLNKTKAVRIVERIGSAISGRLGGAPAARVQPELLERLADAIVSVEYYMETVSSGRQDPWYMLDNAERCLDLLERVAQPAPEETAQPPAPREPAEPAEKPVMEVERDRSEPELLELFIEEAKEEAATIARRLPAWLQAPERSEELIAVRRSFHTLKGSGRMVGAQLIGEYAWNIENLLNRIINQTLMATPAMLEFVKRAADALPQLVDQLEIGIQPKADIAMLMKQAESFARGGGPLEGVETPEATEELEAEPSVEEAEPATAGPRMDPVLAEIFVKEMRDHLAVIHDYLARNEAKHGPYVVDEPLYRACHTLLGSANMAGFKPAMALAAPLAEDIRRHHEAGSTLDEAALGALAAAAAEMERMAEALAGGAEYAGDTAAVVERLRALAPRREAQPESGEPAPATTEQTGFDPEIAGIFAEEASEILEHAETALQDYRRNPDGNGAFAELQRFLHTLKGGARMAGIPAMSDLSHALESLLSRLAHDEHRPGQAEFALIQRSLDVLNHMRDEIDAGRQVEADRDLVTQIAAFSPQGPEAAAAEGRPEAPAEPEQPVAPPPLEAGEAEAVETAGAEGEPEAPAEPEQPVAPPPLEAGEAEAVEAAGAQERPEAPAEPGRPVAPPPFEAAGAEEEPEAPAKPEHAGTMVLPPFDIAASASEANIDRTDLTGILEFSDMNLAEPEAIGDLAGEIPAEERLEEPGVESLATEAPSGEPQEPAPIEAPAPESTAEPTSAAPARSRPVPAVDRAETARVDADLLDSLLNGAGEISIFQSRLNQQMHSIEFHLGELGQTVTRLREQLRKLEAETEAQILHRHQQDLASEEGFDPLELDRYSTIQQLSRALAETANDVASINELLGELTNDTDTLLTQQARVTTDLQDGLMKTRMVPFQRHVSRLARIVRQACADTGKQAELFVEGAGSELDRQVLERMLPPFEHLLRNAVVHGIEPVDVRKEKAKPEGGRIDLKLKREGSEVLIEVADDGAGLDLEAIRRKARDQGLLSEGAVVTDEQAVELILKPGFSTAGELTQAAGRGVGMDVVDSEVKKLGGSMHVETKPGEGTRFVIRLPYTLAITQALIVDVGEETFALPLPTVEGVARVPKERLLTLLTEDDPQLEYGGVSYRVQHLGTFVGAAPSALPEDDSAVALVLVRAGENSTALLTDALEGSREVVVKTLGPHLASVAGVSGATILGDGRIIVILDAPTLVRSQKSTREAKPIPRQVEQQVSALVVDDSITMRRVTARLLERRGVKVVTARDGLDAITVLQEHLPDIILLDIEMPRMDGYRFAAHVRNDPRLKDVPIIMITSRSGEKHRARAIEIGVNDYLSKPYQEGQLIAAIEGLLGRSL